MRIFLLLLLVPLVEIGLFIQVGGLIGLWPTLLVVVATAVGGTMLLRREGPQILGRLRDSLAQGRDPSTDLLHGLLVFVGALLLLTPGFCTDAVGIVMLVPQGRDLLIRFGRQTIVCKCRVLCPPQPVIPV